MNRGNRENRNFGLVMAGACLLLALANFQWLGVAFIVGVLSMVQPEFLEYPRRGWMKLGRAMHFVTEPLVLGLIFFLVLTPTGIFRRLMGKSRVAPVPLARSYWRLKKTEITPEYLRRQY